MSFASIVVLLGKDSEDEHVMDVNVPFHTFCMSLAWSYRAQSAFTITKDFNDGV